MATGRRVGSSTERRVTTVRALSSGHLHEVASGVVGYYAHGEAAALGDEVILHTDEKLELAADAALVVANGATVNFDFADQTAKAAGTAIGKCEGGKTAGQTTIIVILNNRAEAVSMA